METAIKKDDYSSYARILMTISSFGKVFKGDLAESTKVMGIPMNIISNEEVKQTLNDPINQDIKTVMRAEAGRVEMAMNIQAIENQIKLQKSFITESLTELAPKKDASPAEKESLRSTQQALENQFRKLNTIQESLKQNYKQLTHVDEEIARITEAQEKERNEFRKQSLADVVNGFSKMNLSGKEFLNDDERTELLRTDSWNDVVKRFQDLGVPWPKEVNREKPAINAYFQLKSFLAIRSALSRNFLPHDYDNVMKHMKQLTDVFKQIQERGENIYQKQDKISRDLINNEVRPILDSLTSNDKLLERMNVENRNLMSAVAPSQVEAIEQRSKTRAATVEIEKPSPR